MKRLTNLLGKVQRWRHWAQSRLLEYLGVQHEKQLRTVPSWSRLQGLQVGDCNIIPYYLLLRGLGSLALNFLGKFFVQPKNISTASLKDLCLFVRGTVLINLCWENNTGLPCIRSFCWRSLWKDKITHKRLGDRPSTSDQICIRPQYYRCTIRLSLTSEIPKWLLRVHDRKICPSLGWRHTDV